MTVSGHEWLGEGLKVLVRLDDSPSFPVVRLRGGHRGHLCPAPYVTRPVRRIGQAFVLFLALAALYLGTGFPNGVFAAVALGWGWPPRSTSASALPAAGRPERR